MRVVFIPLTIQEGKMHAIGLALKMKLQHFERLADGWWVVHHGVCGLWQDEEDKLTKLQEQRKHQYEESKSRLLSVNNKLRELNMK
jgi:hypothetical protein